MNATFAITLLANGLESYNENPSLVEFEDFTSQTHLYDFYHTPLSYQFSLEYDASLVSSNAIANLSFILRDVDGKILLGMMQNPYNFIQLLKENFKLYYSNLN